MTTPFDCPRCGAPAAGPGLHACAGCGKRFAAYAGPLVDPNLVPAPAGPKVQVKSPGAFLMRYGCVDERGVSEGNLDPVIGTIPVDTSGVWWGDVASIAVWRTPAWLDLVVALLLPLPIGLGLLAIAMSGAWGAAIPGAVFLGLGAYLLWRAFVVQACRARVIGRHRTIVVRFDRPSWRRQRFHDELIRRAGGSPLALP